MAAATTVERANGIEVIIFVSPVAPSLPRHQEEDARDDEHVSLAEAESL